MNRIKSFLIFAVFNMTFFVGNLLFAGNEFQEFKVEKDINSKSRKGLVLWEYYISNSIDSLRILGVELLRDAKKQNSDFGIAISNRILGCYDVRTGKIDRGILLLTASKNFFVSKNDNELICESMNELGIGYFLKGDLETATSFFQSSIKFGKESPVESNRFLAQINLAKVYFEKGKSPEAIFLIRDYIRQASTFKKWESVSNAYSLLGEIALNSNKIRTAKLHFEKQSYFAEKAKSSTYVTRALNNKAIVAFYEEHYNEALDLFKDVLKRRKHENFAFNIYDAYFNLARFYYPDKLDLSLKYVDSCFQIAKENKLQKQEMEVYEWRFQHYKDKKNNQLIDSMKAVLVGLEKQNEQIRKKLDHQNIHTKQITNTSTSWIFWTFGTLFILLISHYFIVYKSNYKIN